MRKVTGQSSASFPIVIGEVVTDRRPFYARNDKILVTDKLDSGCMGYLAILSPAPPKNRFFLPNIVGNICVDDLSMIKPGDIVTVSDDGEISVVWETGSQQNSLMLTESCNCLCKMCPQPPKKHNPILFKVALNTLELLKCKPIENICITGGEPTLVFDDFKYILKKCHENHANAHVIILTNAKKFSSELLAKEIAAISMPNDLFCISLHSDISSIHDEIVGQSSSYNKTGEGVYNLAKNRLNIEIRHVITRLNYNRLLEFAEHMYRYFPFCRHYTFMTMETCGLANKNIEQIFIDPIEYKDQLRKAVLALHKRGLHVSIYNTPLCLCHEDVRSFARRSISSWKNILDETCALCLAKDDCCGFFSTSSLPINRHIHPIQKEVKQPGVHS